MLKQLLFLSFCAFGISAFSQITITNTDFPSGGDTAMISISNDLALDFASTGADYAWDFSALVATEQRIDTFFNVGSASITYQLVFNNGWLDPDYQADYYANMFDFAIPSTDLLGVAFENVVRFTKIESDRVESVGVGIEVGGLQIPVKMETIDQVYQLPLNYLDNWTSPGFLQIDLNPIYNAILRRHQERATEVDGWGSVTTPFGTFDVLRTRAEIDYTDSLRIELGGVETWLTLPTPSQVIYTWLAEDSKIPILEVEAQLLGGIEVVSRVEYKDKELDLVGVGIDEEGTLPAIQFYPNPTQDQVFLSTQAKVDLIEVFSASGQLVQRYHQPDANAPVSVADWHPGTYFFRVTTNENVVIKSVTVH